VAKYILLEFANDSEADAFTSTIVDAGAAGSLTVRAVYKKPTLFCECLKTSDRSLLGEKYGWRVCPTCVKPKRGAWQHPRNLLNPGNRAMPFPDPSKTMYLGIVEGGDKYAPPGPPEAPQV
jgi:hypothetical protein